MTDALSQVQKIDRFLGDPSITAGERFAAEGRRQALIDRVTMDSYAERVKAAESNAKTRPNVNPSQGGSGTARQATSGGNPAQTFRTVDYGTPKAELSQRLRGNPVTAPNALTAVFGALNLGSNLREGWERGNSGQLGNPVLGAITAFEEAAGAFIPAYSIADFVTDSLFDLGRGALDLAGFNSNNSGGSAEQQTSTLVFDPNAGEIIVPGGQGDNVPYIVTYDRVSPNHPGDGCFPPASNIQWGVHGPISFVRDDSNPAAVIIGVMARPGLGQPVRMISQLSGAFNLEACPGQNIVITDIRRNDGLEDTDGDLRAGGLRPQPVRLSGGATPQGAGSIPSPPLIPQPSIPSSPISQPPVLESPQRAPAQEAADQPSGLFDNIPEVPFFGIPGNARNLAPTPQGLRPGKKIIPPNSPASCSPCSVAAGNQAKNAERNLLDEFKKLSNLNEGAQTAGIASIIAKLEQMQAFAEAAWKNTHLDKVVNLLTLITTLHNASMISRDIGETLGYAVSNGLATVGIRDEEGNALDVNNIIGSTVSNLIKNIVGEDVYDDTREIWQKSNRVLQSASNIVWTIRSINDTTQDVLEWTAENTGKIGNALKKWGVVSDRAYPWMAERVRVQDAYRTRLSRIFDGLESAENAASSLAQVTGDVREIQEEIGELGEARQRFVTAVGELSEERQEENDTQVQASGSLEVKVPLDGNKSNEPSDYYLDVLEDWEQDWNPVEE